MSRAQASRPEKMCVSFCTVKRCSLVERGGHSGGAIHRCDDWSVETGSSFSLDKFQQLLGHFAVVFVTTKRIIISQNMIFP